MATLASFKGPNAGSGNGIGQSGISRAKTAGLTEEQIRQMAASEGLKINSPSGPIKENTSSYGTLASFRGPNAGPGGIGLAGIQRANKAGYSSEQIQQMAQQEGLGFGSLAQISLAYPSPTAPTYSPPGNNESVDGNALGFRRKKSSAKMSGLTSKGTGQFKITGQSGKSSGLNIGI
jgi:hypothetical protein